MGSFLRSYECVKIRVRLMRTEEDVNENEEHFVSVEARLASLSRGCGAGAYFACCAFALGGAIAYADSFMFCGGNCRACVVVCPCSVGGILLCRIPVRRVGSTLMLFVLRLCGWGGILFVVLHFRVGGNIYTRTSFVSLCLRCFCSMIVGGIS